MCRPGPARLKNQPSPHLQARPVGKITSHVMCWPGPTRWKKNHPSCAGPARWKNHLSSAGPGTGPGPGPCSPLIGIQKRILIHYGQWSQFFLSVLVSKQCIQLCSNLVCILQITTLHILSILVNLKLIVFFFFFYRSTKRILIHYSLWYQIRRIMLMSK